jgi:hypothetical protein
VDADQARIDVEAPPDHDAIAHVGRDLDRDRDVVVDLQHVAGARPHLDALVPVREPWVRNQVGIERHLGSVVVLDDRLVEPGVVGLSDRGVRGLIPAAREREQRR